MCFFLQNLKSHAVTMFEVGKLSDESLDSFLIELEKVSALGCPSGTFPTAHQGGSPVYMLLVLELGIFLLLPVSALPHLLLWSSLDVSTVKE
jgi:hypothetical protein